MGIIEDREVLQLKRTRVSANNLNAIRIHTRSTLSIQLTTWYHEGIRGLPVAFRGDSSVQYQTAIALSLNLVS